MEWNVFRFDPNDKKFISYNILSHYRFRKDLHELWPRAETKEVFAKEVEISLRCYFWSRCEHELVLTPWVVNGKEKKIDIYDQVKLNFDAFINYIWERRHKL